KSLRLSISATLFISAIWAGLHLHPPSSSIRDIAVRVSPATSVLSCVAFFCGPWDRQSRLLLYALITIGFFFLILGYEVYNLSLLDGRMRATHGRYTYPVIPLFILVTGIAASKLKILRYGSWTGVVLLAILEL